MTGPYRPALALGAVALAIATAACTTESAASPIPDDQQSIRDVVDTYFTGLAGDFDAFGAAVCDDLAAEVLADLDAATFEAHAADTMYESGRPVVDWFDDVTVDGDHADVTLSVHVNGGTQPDVGPQTWTTTLQRTGGEWRVCASAEPDRATQRKIDVATDERDVTSLVETFFTAGEANDYATGRDITCGTMHQQVVLAESAPQTDSDDVFLVSIDAATVNGDSARVKVTVGDATGAQVHINMVVDRVDGAWKVCDAV